MIVIFEGPDGSGKTTLAREVADKTGATYIHAQAPERHPLVEYTAPLDPNEDYVLDRWHWGEMVYGPLFRGESGLTTEQFWAVEQYLDDLGAVVVLCNGPASDLASRIRERGTDEEAPNLTELSRAATAFKRVADQAWLPVHNSPIQVPMTADEVIAVGREQEARRAVRS